MFLTDFNLEITTSKMERRSQRESSGRTEARSSSRKEEEEEGKAN